MKKIFLFLSVAFISIVSYGQGIEFMENPKWSEVLEKAKKSGQTIFIDCYTTWCGPCKGLAKNTFTDAKAGEYFNANFLCVKMDMEKGDGIMLREKYKEHIPGFPTMLFITPDETLVHKIVGFVDAPTLISAAKSGLEGKTLPKLEERYNKGEIGYDFIIDYLKALQYAFQKEDMENVVKAYIASMPKDSLKVQRNIELYVPYIKTLNAPEVQYIISNISYFNYKLDKTFDRYKLAENLNNAIDRDIRDIVSIKKDSSGNILTLENKDDKISFLRDMMRKYTFKKEGEYLIKLYAYNALYSKDWGLFVNIADNIVKGDLLRNKIGYLNECSLYVLSQTTKEKKNIEQLNKIVESLIVDFSEKDMESNFFICKSLYKMAYRLGDKKKGDFYKNIYDTENKKIQERYNDYIKQQQ